MAKFTGGCLCGKITYSAEADPIFMGLCHCKDCQRSSGSAFEPVIAVPDASLTVQGAPKTYTSKGDSGQAIHRIFCGDCSSNMMSRADIMQGVVMLTTGTLDNASAFNPSMQIYCDSAQHWVHLGGDIKAFPKMPMPG